MEGLTIDLFEPGMGPLHRAGLGGLAATIRWLNDPERGGRLDPAIRPSGTLDYDATSVTLSWGEPKSAGEFFRKLYELAFGLDDGMIHLPGSYGATPPSPEVKAALQAGMSQTILQHPSACKADRSNPTRLRQYKIDAKMMRFQHQNLVDYTHRSIWAGLVTKKGTVEQRVRVKGTIAPGFIQRHVAHPSTAIELPPGHAIALHFVLVGTLPLSLRPGGGALIVPEVENLRLFAERRAWLTPNEPRDCQISGPADAALQGMVRLRRHDEQELLEVRRCQAILFRKQQWTTGQRARAAVLDVEADKSALDRFEIAMSALPPRVAQARADKASGERSEGFWADSVVRPLVADNLARGRPWFENFRSLIVGPDGKTDKSRVRDPSFERKGLKAMIDQPWDCEAEKKLVEAIHDAMRRRFAAIWADDAVDAVTKSKRTDRQKQQWRLALAQAKTPDDVRNALANMWSRSVMEAPYNKVLKESWGGILPLFRDDDRWKLNRDLALLALASYGGGGAKDEAGSGAETAEAPDDNTDDQTD